MHAATTTSMSPPLLANVPPSRSHPPAPAATEERIQAPGTLGYCFSTHASWGLQGRWLCHRLSTNPLGCASNPPGSTRAPTAASAAPNPRAGLIAIYVYIERDTQMQCFGPHVPPPTRLHARLHRRQRPLQLLQRVAVGQPAARGAAAAELRGVVQAGIAARAAVALDCGRTGQERGTGRQSVRHPNVLGGRPAVLPPRAVGPCRATKYAAPQTLRHSALRLTDALLWWVARS